MPSGRGLLRLDAIEQVLEAAGHVLVLAGPLRSAVGLQREDLLADRVPAVKNRLSMIGAAELL